MKVHPLTCNGGNPDWRTHHDHEVIMERTEDGLICPECGRTQALPGLFCTCGQDPHVPPCPLRAVDFSLDDETSSRTQPLSRADKIPHPSGDDGGTVSPGPTTSAATAATTGSTDGSTSATAHNAADPTRVTGRLSTSPSTTARPAAGHPPTPNAPPTGKPSKRAVCRNGTST